VAAYCYGFLVNLSFWPFSLDPQSSIAYRPGASLGVNLHHYLIFDATTSLGWDTGRAVTTAVCILLVGPALLATFRRASRRAAFEAPREFAPPVDPGRVAVWVAGPAPASPTPRRSGAGPCASP
jgi:energy-coupling factor transport system substrate-specific component